jgi:hypothetical protein
LKVTRGGPDECWLWTAGADKNGYGQFTFCDQPIRAHRFAYLVSKGDLNDSLYVLHRCDTPRCCNPEHLFLGTAAANASDKVAKRRHPRGATTWNAKVTDAQAEEIRRLRAQGLKLREIAALVPLKIAAINHICLGRNWGHLANARD